MKSNYRRLGDFIEEVNDRNTELEIDRLLGVSVKKIFIPSIANTVGTNFKNYKIVRRNQFTYIPDTSRRGDKIGVAMLDTYDEAIVSSAYTVFKVSDITKILPEYLMMWFRRPEFNRYARYHSHGSVREAFDWQAMSEVELPVPSLAKQQAIVDEYNVITRRISILEQLNAKLEETAQAIYKHWFVDFEFPNEEGNPYKSSGGKMVWNEELGKDVPVGWEVNELGEVTSKIGSGATPKGGKASYKKNGIPLIRSMNVHDMRLEFKDLAFIDESQAVKLDNVEVKTNDILLNITGASVARCSLVPQMVEGGRVNQHVAIIRPIVEETRSYIFCHLLSTDSRNELLGISGSGSTREALTKGDLEVHKLLMPLFSNCEDFGRRVGLLIARRYDNFDEIRKLKIVSKLILGQISNS